MSAGSRTHAGMYRLMKIKIAASQSQEVYEEHGLLLNG